MKVCENVCERWEKIVKIAIMTLQSTNANELVIEGLVHTGGYSTKKLRFNYLNRQLQAIDER